MQPCELCEKVCLVFDWVFGCAEVGLDGFMALCVFHFFFDDGGVVACGYLVVAVTYLVFEGSEFYQLVAHDIGVWGESEPDSLDGVTYDSFPVFFLQVYDFEFEPILVCRSHA